MCKRFAVRLFRRVPGVAVLVALLVLTPLLGACDIALGNQNVVVVTATQVPQQEVVVVTATFTPGAPASPIPQATPIVPASPIPQASTPDVQATVQAALAATIAAMPTNTSVPPTETPVPPTPDLDATVRAALAATQTAAPTNTPVPPTQTPKPATKTPKPPTKTPTSQVLPPPVLLSPAPEFNCFNIRGCFFSWSWGGSLAANQYFQVQLVGPANEHRGIHPPSKGYSFQSDYNVYQIIRDWCDPSKMCHMQWTVAIIEWDGVDPSKIGRTLIEVTPPRWITL